MPKRRSYKAFVIVKKWKKKTTFANKYLKYDTIIL